LWDNKPEKIKRDIITQAYCNGGLKMINIEKYMISLKSSWLRRCIVSNSRWIKLFESTNCCNMSDIINYGDDYVRRKLINISNPFWKHVFEGWLTILEKKTPTITSDIYNSSLWYNSRITIGKKSIIYKNYIGKGVLIVKDILDDQSNPMSYEEFRQKYNINTNFLEYNSLLKAVKCYMQKYEITETYVDLQKPSLPENAKLLLSNTKGCRTMYNVINKTYCVPSAQKKYENIVTNNQDWKKYYILPFKCSRSTNTQWFQYRILHNFLATNYFLHKIKYSDTDRCTFCKAEPETIVHLFFECVLVQEFWNTVCQWIHNVRGITVPTTVKNILFGIPEKKSKVINWLILQTKQYIYSMKMQEKNLNIFALQNIISSKFLIEKFILFKNCQFKEYNTFWATWITLTQ